MAEKTGITWTDHTWNPWWGCDKVSPGCTNCYAQAFDARVGGSNWGPGGTRRVFGDKHWNEPRAWARKAEKAGVRARIFCASMADYLEDHPVADANRPRLWDLIRETSCWLDWQLLTKRHDRLDLVPIDVRSVSWGMVSVEDQPWADKRVPLLLASDGWKVRGVSYEPALGPVDFSPALSDRIVGCAHDWPVSGPAGVIFGVTRCKRCNTTATQETLHATTVSGLDWIVIGGESGPHARPFDVEWARSVIAQCKVANVSAFCKQIGARPMMRADSVEGRRSGDHPEREWPEGTRFGSNEADMGTEWQGRRAFLRDSHGADMAEWPEDLRVRQFPEVTP